MNRVLSLPITQITREQLEQLKSEKHLTRVSENGNIKLRHRNGFLELRFLLATDRLVPFTAVCVWWKGGGFVCASQAELLLQAQEAQIVAQQVAQTRAKFAAARNARHNIGTDTNVAARSTKQASISPISPANNRLAVNA